MEAPQAFRGSRSTFRQCLLASFLLILSNVALDGTERALARGDKDRESSGASRSMRAGDGSVSSNATLGGLRSRIDRGRRWRGGVPIAPSVVVDYRVDGPPVIELHHARIPSQGIALSRGAIGPSASATACFFDVECDDCDPCTVDVCASATCTGGDHPGAPCMTDLECAVGGTCTVLTGPACMHTPVPEGAPSLGCDDGEMCNGQEFCVSGGCTDGTDDLCTPFPGHVCESTSGVCVLLCAADADCEDGEQCNGTETCELATGRCHSDGRNPCGAGASCREPPSGQGQVTCGQGRCCDEFGICQRLTRDQCASGKWSAVGLSTADCSDTPCPIYSSGLAPEGTFVASIGPVSASPCDPLRVGDDYQVEVGAGPQPDFVEVYAVRFAAGAAGDAVRFSVEFYDINGVFVEDVFFPDNLSGGFAIRTLEFQPPLTIPAAGRIAFTTAANFNPDAEITLLTTDMADVGANDATNLFVNGADAAGFLEACVGGAREGQWCSPFGNPLLSAQACVDGGGNCVAQPNLLVFEILGEAGSSPEGACCSAADGSCRVELPWICDNVGDVFQGEGSFCKSCSNDFLVGCATVADCPAKACVGGNLDGQRCNSDLDCPGGTCTGTPICNPVPPACSVSGCCDPGSGSCFPVQTICLNSVDPFYPSPCSTDADCLPGEGPCRNQYGLTTCPPGTQSLGFGSSCEPNCCGQPVLSGGDNCTVTPVVSINVPPVGAAPVTITLSGSNGGATFDEFLRKVCQGGVTDGAFCSTDVDCVGGTCTGSLCGLSLFDPAGDRKDPGWLEGFELDACADVRVDLCCSEPVLQPAWAMLIDGCPCGDLIAARGVEPGIGLGRGAVGSARGGPFCNDDNVWLTFGPLPAGRYFYPIFSAPGSTFSAPPGGNYQVHITAGACGEAACCYTACVGGSTPDQPCRTNSECLDGGTCSSLCSVLTEPECDAREGFWLIAENRPPGSDTIGSCSSSTCAIGSCCFGPGSCEDVAVSGTPCDPILPETCMDHALCSGMGGGYVGGSGCDYPVDACPVCTAESATGCQFPDVAFAYDVDQTGFMANQRVADDFIAVGSEIRQFCWWPYMFHPLTGMECDAPLPDQWELRFYKDDGGLPGGLLSASPGPVSISASVKLVGQPFRYQYSVVLETPVPVESGKRYWVEMTARGDPDTCVVNVAGSSEGNKWSLYDIDGATWTQGDRNRFVGDIAFCIDTGGAGMEIPEVQTGACCDCGGQCADGLTSEACLGALTLDGDPVGDTIGRWWVGQAGADVDWEAGRPAGDDCSSAVEVFDGTTTVYGHCATTDGRTSLNCDAGNTISSIENDIWYTYQTTCTGALSFDLCADTDFDAVLAVFADGTSFCSSTCPPPEETLVNGACNDLGCNTIRGGGRIDTYTLPDRCYKIRVASDNPGQTGEGLLEVLCLPEACLPSDPPEPERIANTVGTMVVSAKSRFLSFRAGAAGRRQAVRVTFQSLPAPFHVWNDLTLWVGPPEDVSEISGVGFGDPIGDAARLRVATLQCDPHYTDWHGEGMVHVFHEGIVPGTLAAGGGVIETPAVYVVQVVDETCNAAFEGSFSPVWEIRTGAWADVGGPFDSSTQRPSAPDLRVTVPVDLIGLIDKFANFPTAPSKPRADLEGAVVDGVIRITDVTLAVDAFRGASYPFTPGALPCP